VPRLILLLAIIAVVYLLFRRAQSLPPHRRKAEYAKLGLAVAVIVVIGLTITGRMHWIGIAFTGLLVAVRQFLPTLIRLFPMLASRWGQAAPGSAGQTSTVETGILRMQLAHDSGELQGEVLQGTFQGWFLKEMSREQLVELLQYCQATDPESVQLLDSYLQQRFPGETDFSQQQAGNNDSGDMNRREALSILGLPEDASDEDIVAAHRKLIQKLHPDRGGNDYLASKINQAKDFLLG
jgi:hypothetical protein